MNPAQESARRLLKSILPLSMLENINRVHSLQLSPGATFRDALNARLLQLAEAGDPKAQEMVKLYGFDGKTTPIL